MGNQQKQTFDQLKQDLENTNGIVDVTTTQSTSPHSGASSIGFYGDADPGVGNLSLASSGALLQPGTVLVETSEFTDDRRWEVKEVVFDHNGLRLGYLLGFSDGSHTECYSAETLVELIKKGMFSVSTNLFSNRSSTSNRTNPKIDVKLNVQV